MLRRRHCSAISGPVLQDRDGRDTLSGLVGVERPNSRTSPGWRGGKEVISLWIRLGDSPQLRSIPAKHARPSLNALGLGRQKGSQATFYTLVASSCSTQHQWTAAKDCRFTLPKSPLLRPPVFRGVVPLLRPSSLSIHHAPRGDPYSIPPCPPLINDPSPLPLHSTKLLLDHAARLPASVCA